MGYVTLAPLSGDTKARVSLGYTGTTLPLDTPQNSTQLAMQHST
jgi:hypothetical protein